MKSASTAATPADPAPYQQQPYKQENPIGQPDHDTWQAHIAPCPRQQHCRICQECEHEGRQPPDIPRVGFTKELAGRETIERGANVLTSWLIVRHRISAIAKWDTVFRDIVVVCPDILRMYHKCGRGRLCPALRLSIEWPAADRSQPLDLFTLLVLSSRLDVADGKQNCL